MNHKIQRWFFFNDDKKEHVRALDGLRGIAVIMVLLSHSSNNQIYFHKAIAFNGIGKGGVYLFFVLSAYLLDSQIASAMMNHSADYFFWRRYFIKRFLRIFPLFIVSLFIFWMASNAGIPTSIVNGVDMVKHVLLWKGNGVFWSIPVEFKYYILSPFILLVCQRYLKWNIRSIALFFVLLSGATLMADTIFELNKISTLKYLLVFLTGTFLAIYNILVQPAGSDTGWMKRAGIFGMMALIFCLVMNPNYMGDWMGISNSNNGRKLMIIYALLCGVMLFAALYDQGLFRRFLENKFLRFIGVISFSVYLFHMPVIYVMNQNFMFIPDPLKIYFFFGITICLSVISYLLIERPLSMIRIRKS